MTEASEDATEGGPWPRWYQVVLVGVVAVAFVGFFVGTREGRYEEFRERRVTETQRDRADEERATEVREAPSYRELMDMVYDKNTNTRTAIERYRAETPRDWSRGADRRSANRAYDGAPPTVPHPVRERSAEACIACHGDGIRVRDRTGTEMPHEYMVNCLQCHTSTSPKRPFGSDAPATVAAANGFRGAEAPDRGERAYAGAPPRIPHRTQMRSDCSSCHGNFGLPGPMSHEAMPNCRQCHAGAEGPPGGAPPETVPAGNRFAGLGEPGPRGARAWEGAPPEMPHQYHMRENCNSCHGPGGDAEIRTSHPWRQSCTQCHAQTGAGGVRPPSNLQPFSATPPIPGGAP